MMAQKRQSDVEPLIIPKVEAEESIKAVLGRWQRKKEEARLMANTPIEQTLNTELQKKTYLSVPFREKMRRKALVPNGTVGKNHGTSAKAPT